MFTADQRKYQENVKLTTFTQIRNTANYCRLIFHYRRPILTCGKATCETDGNITADHLLLTADQLYVMGKLLRRL